ncbi:MAG: putative amidohydrolase YtcJ [Planctomycetota bacterium]|jgi:predicted amidohydrolase YtcJ
MDVPRSSRILLTLLCGWMATVTLIRAAPEGDAHTGGLSDGLSDGITRLYYGGIFHTGDRQEDGGDEPLQGGDRTVEALLVRDGRIVALGDRSEISESNDAFGAERIDLGGAHCYPGFQDSHADLEAFGASLENVDLAGATSFRVVVERARAYASALPEGEWVVGRGWDQTLWDGAAALPKHDELSQAIPAHPVFLLNDDGEVGLANQAAMAAAGVKEAALLLTGIFRGEALEQLSRSVPVPARGVRERRLLRAQDALLPLGITAVHGMPLDAEGVKIIAALRDSGKLKLRVVGYLDSLKTARMLGAEGLAAMADRHDVFSIAGVYLSIDGSLGSRTAALLTAYADAPETTGTAHWKVQDLSTEVEGIARMGLQPCVGAHGDGAVRIVLAAFRQASQRFEGFGVLAPRVEYLHLLAEEDLRHLKDFGVVPSMQPAQLLNDIRWLPARLGASRAQRSHRWRFVQANASQLLAMGSGVPMSSPDPRLGIYAAMTRQVPADEAPTAQAKKGFYVDQQLSADAAVGGYTAGAAAAALQDDRRGRLALGYAADFTALDIDIGRLAPATASRLLTAKVVATVINGRIVYRAD